MIVDPYLERGRVLPFKGTRLLQETFDLVGAQIIDPDDSSRRWDLKSFYSPIHGRALGGVRARLVDQKGFTTFCNQRDLEVLLGMGEPGTYCPWARQEYTEPGDRTWYGFSMDEDDLEDDLQDREMLLRAESPTGILFGSIELLRRLHLDTHYDVEELDALLWDCDPDTGFTPDMRLETIDKRWTRVERQRVQWRHLR